MTLRPPPRASSGFTLIEMVISAALGAVILVNAYMCLSSALASQKLIEQRTDVLQSARVAMALISADLRSACPLSAETQFLGMHRTLGDVEADNLDFGTHNYTPRRSREGDFCQVSFYLEKDPRTTQFVLWRRRNPIIALDPLSGGSREEIARGVRGVRFEYYDGFDWYDTWGEVRGHAKAQSSLREQPNLSGMPEAVRITLWFDSKPSAKRSETLDEKSPEPPMMFQTVSRLNLASVSSSTGSAGGSSGPLPTAPRVGDGSVK